VRAKNTQLILKSKYSAALAGVGKVLAVGAMAIAPVLLHAADVSYPTLQGQIKRGSESVSALGSDLMGDQSSLFSGSLEFVHTDVSLPGNNALPVSIVRKHTAGRDIYIRGELGDWDLEIPRVSGVFASTGGVFHVGGWVSGSSGAPRCSAFAAPPSILLVHGDSDGNNQSVDWNPYEYWQGTFLHIPGGGSREILKRSAANTSAPSDGQTYPLVTRDHWQIRCLSSIQNAPGEGFVALSPDGTTYRFDRMKGRNMPNLKFGETLSLPRAENMLLATLVTDRFGNTVTYSYDGNSKLTRIESSDGRVITLAYYGNGLLQTVNDGSRIWTYVYDGNGVLNRVVLPDGSDWVFSLRSLVYLEDSPLGELATCDLPGFYSSFPLAGTVKHPSGALGTFTTKYIKHPRFAVTKFCVNKTGKPTGPKFPLNAKLLPTQSLISKSITGPGLPTLTWNFSYPTVGVGTWTSCVPPACAGIREVLVTDPRGVVTRNVFGAIYQVNEGQLLRVDEGWNGTSAPRATVNTYRAPSGQPYPEPAGISVMENGDYLSARHRPADSRVITQQSTTFTWQVNAFDSKARATNETRFSSQGNTTTNATAYYDHTTKWILSQVASVTEASTGLVVKNQTFNATTGTPENSYSFGRLTGTTAYDASGTLYAVYDPLNRWTVLSNYKRGTPQNIGYYDGTSESGIVNNLGNVTSHTNAAGTTTTYGHDAMGRLASITYPGGDPVSYHPTYRAFEQVWTSEYGLPAGHWRHTTSAGNSRSITYYDAFWRPRMTRTYDIANESNTSKMTVIRYDADAAKSFESYPQRFISSVDATVTGTAFVYDNLRRITTQNQDSEIGVLATTTEYLVGAFQRRVTNPRGYQTTTAFQVFDTPSEDTPSTLWAPEGVTVVIARDVFGKPHSINRAGMYAGSPLSVTRSYVYDSYQRLCKTIEPESGATIQAYDGANNLEWKASGLNLPSTTSCDQASVPANRKIQYGYYWDGKLMSTVYGDGSPSVTRNYTADGLPWQISSAGATWTLSYNNRRLMWRESFATAQTVSTFDHGFDAYGSDSSLTYPGGLAVSYAPNALGEPSQVGSFASGISYHPNGSVAGYSLGNGIAYTVTQNTRGLPLLARHAGVSQDLYSYDTNGNVASIVDQQEGLASRSMGYDGLDRLTAANGIWGGGTYGYDPIDNLRTTTVGSRTTVATFDAMNRLSNLSINGTPTVYNYDLNGNLTLRGAQGFAFDIGNRLSAAYNKASYIYDGHGRRTWVNYSDGSTKFQIYGQGGKLLQSSHSSQGVTQHVYLGTSLIAEVNSQSGTKYSHTDALGSPIAQTSASGGLVDRTRYEPYGATAAGTNPTGIGFTGHVNDADTGLVYMQQRYYDPTAARFLSVDPVTTNTDTASGFNRYSYSSENPYKYTDPDGREIVSANPNNNAQLASAINSQALGTFAFGKDNKLTMVKSTGDSSKYSTHYQNRLVDGINAKSTITLEIAPTYDDGSGTPQNVDTSAGGGATISYSDGSQKVVISGNSTNLATDAKGGSLTMSPAEILTHELVGHAVPAVSGKDTGNAIANENKVRAEKGSPQRKADPQHHE